MLYLRFVFAACVLIACDGPGGRSTTPSTSDVADTTDATSGDATADTSPTTIATDTSATDTIATDTIATDTSATDTIPTDTTQPSATSPSVGCRVDADCGSGKSCCTNGNSWLSECIESSDCDGGAHDACLTDDQCRARRPGEWTTCCHDRMSRNYCAPAIETCQPLLACASPSDCAGNGNEVCCSPHRYYGQSFCTSSFFANPAEDCPE